MSGVNVGLKKSWQPWKGRRIWAALEACIADSGRNVNDCQVRDRELSVVDGRLEEGLSGISRRRLIQKCQGHMWVWQ